MSTAMEKGKLVPRQTDEDGRMIQPRAGDSLEQIYDLEGASADVVLGLDHDPNHFIRIKVESGPSGSFKKQLPLQDGDFAYLREIERSLGANDADHLAVHEVKFGRLLLVTDTLSGKTIQLGRVTAIAPR